MVGSWTGDPSRWQKPNPNVPEMTGEGEEAATAIRSDSFKL
jgi:hypothetical protein